MEFLSPTFLYGLVLLGLPLLIHFVRRRRYREVSFPAIRFLMQSFRQRSRSLKINRLLLLLIRFFMILLIIMAFARPALKVQRSHKNQAQGGTTVLVMDDSASMALVSGQSSLMEKARQEAQKVLGELGPGDLAGLITTTGSHRLAPRAGAEILRVLETLEPRPLAGDVGRALSEALALRDGAAATASQAFRILLISDFQSGDLAGISSLPAGVMALRVGDGRVPEQPLLRIGSVVTPQGAVTPGKAFGLSAQIENLGATDSSPGKLVMRIGERESSFELPAVAAGEKITVSLKGQVDKAGHHPGVLRIEGSPENSLVASRNFVLRAHGTFYALIVGSAPWRLEQDAPGFFISMGLNPQAAMNPGSTAGEGAMVPVTINLSKLLEQKLDSFNALFLTGVSSLGLEQLKVLEDYVRRGGTLIVLPGRGVDASAFDAGFTGLLPARVTGELRIPAEERLNIGYLDREHPLIASFGDAAPDAFAAAAFSRALSLSVNPLERDVRVIAGFDAQAPAMVEGSLGLGRVLITAFSFDLDWGNLPLQSIFPALLQQIMAQMCSARQSYESLAECGGSVTIRMPLGSDRPSVTAQCPDGTMLTATPDPTPSLFLAQLGPLQQAGHYEIVTDRAGRLDKGLVAANPPSSEYTLEFVDLKDLSGTGNREAADMQRVETWRWLLVALSLLACLELLLANRYLKTDPVNAVSGFTGRAS